MFKQNKTKEKLSKTIMVFLFLLFLLSRNTALNPCYAQFTSSSQEFNNASTVAQTFKDYYSGVDYATFNGEEFEQGFIDTCSLPKYGGLNNCQHMARVPAKGAVDHAFIYKINGNPDDLAKAKYLIGKMVNLYDSWKTINSVDFHSWSLNAGVSYALGLASWIIWDELDSTLQQSVKYIIVNEANQFLERQPTSREANSSWGIDTKAEENAAVVGLLAMAANFFPEEENASQWEAQAKLFAYHSVTVAKDAAYGGLKTITALDNGDAVGIFRKTTPRATFALDYDGDFIWSRDIWDIDGDKDYGENGLIKIPNATGFTLEPIEREYNFGYPTDLPFAGDWNGDGLSEIGVYRPSANKFYLDTGDGRWQTGVDIASGTFGMAGDVPIIGDWNGDSRDEIGTFRIENDGRGAFVLDYNGNRQWDSGIDKIYYFGTSGDIPVAGKWNNSSKSYIGVYRPSDFTFYLDWDGNYQLSSSSDRSYTFRPAGTSTNLVPIIGNWNDNDTARDAIGVYDADNGIFYPDFNNDFLWDAVNDSVNLPLKFGTTGDIPIVGHWQNKQRFWIVNHAIRPQVDYMAAEPAFLLRAFLVYKKANKPIPSELTHNILSLWNNLKQYIDPADFSWNVYTDWQNTGLFCTAGAETLPCLALGTECDFERSFLNYKATNSYARTFIEKPVTAQTQFLYPDPGDGTRSTHLNYVVTERFIIVALSHDPSLLPSLPLRVQTDTTAPTPFDVTDEGETTTKTDQLYASWTSSDDPESGLAEYKYKITQDSITGTMIREWPSTGTTPYVTAGGLNLQTGKTYYFTVKAINGAGLWSEASSDGIVIEADIVNSLSFGHFDVADATQLGGWAIDPDAPQTSIKVHLYRDGPAGQGVWLGETVANKERADVCRVKGDQYKVGDSCLHGFSVSPYPVLLDGKTHTVYAYAINTAGGKNPHLADSPKTINPPQVVSIDPSLGSSTVGQEAWTFTTIYSDADGASDIMDARFLINTQIAGHNCFYGLYNQNTDKLYLRNNANSSWEGGFAPESDNVIKNTYAELDCSKTTVDLSPDNILTINWNISFTKDFLGTKNTYLYVKDDAGFNNGGWEQKGTWTIN